jgi:hypothetical protein
MKPTPKIIALTVAVAALFPLGYSVGQSTPSPGYELLDLDIATTQLPDAAKYRRMAEIYRMAPDNSVLLNDITRYAIAERAKGNPVSLQVVQVHQAQKIIEQNAEMIKLLREIKEKK